MGSKAVLQLQTCRSKHVLTRPLMSRGSQNIFQSAAQACNKHFHIHGSNLFRPLFARNAFASNVPLMCKNIWRHYPVHACKMAAVDINCSHLKPDIRLPCDTGRVQYRSEGCDRHRSRGMRLHALNMNGSKGGLGLLNSRLGPSPRFACACLLAQVWCPT